MVDIMKNFKEVVAKSIFYPQKSSQLQTKTSTFIQLINPISFNSATVQSHEHLLRSKFHKHLLPCAWCYLRALKIGKTEPPASRTER